MDAARPHTKILNATLIIVSLGYFIDAFDLFLFNAVRMPSLRELGLGGDALTKTGINILNFQVAGYILGGFLWGILGDKIGRKKALLGSVLLYSLGSLGCAFVHDVTTYSVLRFLTGAGLAGEAILGAVLVSETVQDKQRNWALVIYATFSAIAIFTVNLMAEFTPWRMCYAIGGGAGLLLLLARMGLLESFMFVALADTKTPRGSLLLALRNPNVLLRYICSIGITMSYLFMANMLVTLAPEFGKAVGVEEPVKTTVALMCFIAGQFVADIMAVVVSCALKSRRKATALYMGAAAIACAVYLTLDHPTSILFYAVCGVMGFFSIWVLLLFTAVEQFGTNMRATLGVSAISMGRATLIVTTSIFLALRGAGFDIISAAAWVQGGAVVISLFSLLGLRETYNRNLDFIESKPIKL